LPFVETIAIIQQRVIRSWADYSPQLFDRDGGDVNLPCSLVVAAMELGYQSPNFMLHGYLPHVLPDWSLGPCAGDEIVLTPFDPQFTPLS
jgi:hypothetical protein